MNEWICDIQEDEFLGIKIEVADKIRELVRCKDCEYKNVIRGMYTSLGETLFCRAIEQYVAPDFFCKYGEKVSE